MPLMHSLVISYPPWQAISLIKIHWYYHQYSKIISLVMRYPVQVCFWWHFLRLTHFSIKRCDAPVSLMYAQTYNQSLQAVFYVIHILYYPKNTINISHKNHIFLTKYLFETWYRFSQYLGDPLKITHQCDSTMKQASWFHPVTRLRYKSF